MSKKTINIIGSGIGGMAVAIRLAQQGHKVTVFEKNAYPGGKLSELRLGKYRFDKGPSLFTMPQLIDELSELAGDQREIFKSIRLKQITNYFYEDGTIVEASSDTNAFAEELHQKLQEDPSAVKKHLKKSAFYYRTVSDLFIHQSLSRFQNFLNFKTLKGIVLSPGLNIFKTMHQANAKRFRNKKTIQLFDRYATYNGSNPYKTPALLNLIPHLEFGMGAYLPEKGMHQITLHLQHLAKKMGVEFKFGSTVEKITIQNEKVTGISSGEAFFASDLVVSDMDIHPLYKHLLPEKYSPAKLLRQEKSSSAYVFYWGIKKEFEQLHLHNILFTDDYKAEFEHLFEKEMPYEDPTIYINITSKYCKEDAPKACENWFVMVNVPHNKSGKEINYAGELRKQVIKKINRILKTSIEDYIEEEAILDPKGIELQTSSIGGSLYGNSSNNKYSAFLRHSNYSHQLKGLYFVGGSVHPGGGIPLCLMSAKIVADLIKTKK